MKRKQMFEILKIIPLMVGGQITYNLVKDNIGLPVGMLYASNRVLNWKKDREYTGWQTEILIPGSDFFKVINVGDGFKTVGWGLTDQLNNIYPNDCKITHYGQVFTRNQIERMYSSGKKKFEDLVKYYLKGKLIPQPVFDACVSVVYNTGAALFKNKNGTDTNFYKHLKNGKFEDARLNLTWWKSGGVELPGLIARRMGEHAIYLGKTPKSHQYYLERANEFKQTMSATLL